MVERSEKGPGREEAGDLVGERERCEERRLIAVAADLRQPRERLGKRAEARTVTVRAGLPVRGDAHDDEPWIRLLQRCRREVEPLQDAGSEALDDGVCRLDETQEGFSALRVLQVERDRSLVAPDQKPPGAAVTDGLAHRRESCRRRRVARP